MAAFGAIRHLFIRRRLYYCMGGIAVCLAFGFWLRPFYGLGLVALLGLFIAVLLEIFKLFGQEIRVNAQRHLPRVLTLGDEQPIRIDLENASAFELLVDVVDELPEQFQIRDFRQSAWLQAGEKTSLTYTLHPLTRGEYHFGHLLLFASTRMGLLERRLPVAASHTLPVYPSILQMKQMELRASDRLSQFAGIKQMRRLGHSYEFDQIKNYVRGDDYRSINWKATGRKATLMVNQYEDERAQQVYLIIDKSRVMQLPFGGMSLMDYAINTSLAMANIALKKHDRVGLLTFSDKLGGILRADSQPAHLSKLLLTLYKEQARDTEANYELLYYFSRKLVSGRSLLLLMANFESMYALDRVLPILRRVNAAHLLVVIFFENTDVQNYIQEPATDVERIYQQTIARKYLAEKRAIVQKLRQHGIQSILTTPQDLSINTINKYLELKARGLI